MAGAPVMAAVRSSKNDPNWKDYVLFHEYSHGDYGAGLGESHQTGCTGLVATFIEMFGRIDGTQYLAGGKAPGFKQQELVGLNELAPGNCGPLGTQGKNYHSNVLQCC